MAVGPTVPPGAESYHEWLEIGGMLRSHMERNGGHVDVTAFHLHAHNTATAMWVERVSEQEGGPARVIDLASIRPYHGYTADESFMPLKDPVSLRRDDRLRLHCVFNASHRDYVTQYGVSNGDEMCVMLLVFQPALSPPSKEMLGNGPFNATNRSKTDPGLLDLTEAQRMSEQSEWPLAHVDLLRTYKGDLLSWSGFGEAFLRSQRAEAMGWRREES
jgi:hypothetical protein